MPETREKLLLVVVAKAPMPGKVKTRLCPALTPEEASNLYRCFLQDRVSEMLDLKGIDLAIYYTPADAEEYFSAFTSNGIRLFPQRGRDLGERLHNIFAEKLQQGYTAVAIIDSDTPDLPKSIMQQSFQRLSSKRIDALFGPCRDGGYYLVGMCAPHPELFRNIPWSTATVLQTTLTKAESAGIQTELLPWWNDLDRYADLLEYYHKYKHKLPGKNWTGKRTFEYLSGLKNVRQHVACITGPESFPRAQAPPTR